MTISTELVIAVLGFATALLGIIGGAKLISRKQKSKNSSKTSIRQSGIGKVSNTVGDVGSTFKTSQKSDEGKDESF